MTIINDHQVFHTPGRPFGAIWFLTVPWAHPLWSQYFVSLCDLTTQVAKPAMIVRAGMTHEVMVWAVDPKFKLGKWEDRPKGGFLLQPANHGYQFKAESDEAATARIAGYIDAIDKQQLSPDTDWRGVWNEMFQDGASLHWNALERAAATVQ